MRNIITNTIIPSSTVDSKIKLLLVAKKRLISRAIVLMGLLCFFNSNVEAKPLKVYILAGQSNMEGHAKLSTFDYIGDDPATAPMLKEMRDADGKPRVCEKVWISYLTGIKTNGEGSGKLTVGYGARGNPAEASDKIGPEFTFGIYMQKAVNEPILIIKTAWGGKDLFCDFRPPSAGKPVQKFIRRGKEREEGKYYRLMIEHVKKVLGNIKSVCPDYDVKQGYEVAGFVWFQGWNDMVSGDIYPNRQKPGGYDLYSELLGHFIRDVRKDLSTPKMPFVIGVMGVGGIQEKPNYFRQAMAAPAALTEFKGNVLAVETAPFFDMPLEEIATRLYIANKARYYLKKNEPAHIRKHPGGGALLDKYMDKDGRIPKEKLSAFMAEYIPLLVSPEEQALLKRGTSNAGYHYLGSAKTMGQIGKAFAEALLKMQKK